MMTKFLPVLFGLIFLGSNTFAEQSESNTPQPPSACLTDPLVLRDIEDKKQVIEEKEQYLVERAAELDQREKAIEEKIKELTAIKNEIGGIQGEKKAKRGERISKLVETFEKMSPKAAANILGSLEERLAVDTLEQISSLRLAKILGKMPPEKSSRLSEYLVNRRAPSRRPTKTEGSGS